MNKNFSIAVGVFIIYFIIAYMFWGNWFPQSREKSDDVTSVEKSGGLDTVLPINIPTPTPFKDDISQQAIGDTNDIIVEMTQNGFFPETISVNIGEKVTFINRAERPMWPASDVHPTHRSYPGSDIAKCRAGDSTIFDACRGITPGGTWSFTFSQQGTWSYHDHFNPGKTGVIIVR